MSEKQYAHYKDLPRQELGLMSGEIWQRDPKMLGIHLARYKFVAKMLAGKDRVAEVGCGDGWYSRVVEQQVNTLDKYDFDPQMDGKVLDITKYKLPIKYDAIYSLDCFEHIAIEDTEKYLCNICASLEKNGIFIVGIPSLESQRYASQASLIGHVNCMNKEQLQWELEDKFHNVFMFGMNDETLHTGFGSMCHYLLGVCCGVR